MVSAPVEVMLVRLARALALLSFELKNLAAAFFSRAGRESSNAVAAAGEGQEQVAAVRNVVAAGQRGGGAVVVREIGSGGFHREVARPWPRWCPCW